MKFIPMIIFALGAVFYLIDVIQRATGYIGFVPNVNDAIAMCLLAGVAALIWGPRKLT